MEQEGADGVKEKEQDTNTDAVGPTRTGTLHGEHHLPQLGQSHPGDTKTTRTNPRQAAGDVCRHPRASQASRNTRADIDKIGIHLVRRSGGESGGVTTLTSDQQTDSAVKRAATLSPQPRLYICPTVTPNRRPDPPVKFTEGRRSPLMAQHSPPLCHQTQGRRGDSWRPGVSDTRGPERGVPVENRSQTVGCKTTGHGQTDG